MDGAVRIADDVGEVVGLVQHPGVLVNDGGDDDGIVVILAGVDGVFKDDVTGRDRHIIYQLDQLDLFVIQISRCIMNHEIVANSHDVYENLIVRFVVGDARLRTLALGQREGVVTGLADSDRAGEGFFVDVAADNVLDGRGEGRIEDVLIRRSLRFGGRQRIGNGLAVIRTCYVNNERGFIDGLAAGGGEFLLDELGEIDGALVGVFFFEVGVGENDLACELDGLNAQHRSLRFCFDLDVGLRSVLTDGDRQAIHSGVIGDPIDRFAATFFFDKISVRAGDEGPISFSTRTEVKCNVSACTVQRCSADVGRGLPYLLPLLISLEDLGCEGVVAIGDRLAVRTGLEILGDQGVEVEGLGGLGVLVGNGNERRSRYLNEVPLRIGRTILDARCGHIQNEGLRICTVGNIAVLRLWVYNFLNHDRMRAFCQRYGGHVEVARASCRHRDSTLLLQALSVHGHIDFEGLREASRKRTVDFQSLLDIRREVDIYLNLLELCVIGGVGPLLGRSFRNVLGIRAQERVASFLSIPTDEAVAGICCSGGAGGGVQVIDVFPFIRRVNAAAASGADDFIVNGCLVLFGPRSGKGHVGGRHGAARCDSFNARCPAVEVVACSGGSAILKGRNCATVSDVVMLVVCEDLCTIHAVGVGDSVGVAGIVELQDERAVGCDGAGFNRTLYLFVTGEAGVGLWSGVHVFAGCAGEFFGLLLRVAVALQFLQIMLDGVPRVGSGGPLGVEGLGVVGLCQFDPMVGLIARILRSRRLALCPASEGITLAGRRDVMDRESMLLLGSRCSLLRDQGVRVAAVEIIIQRICGLRERDLTGGDGEGDLYVRTLAVLDREGRFAVEGA